MRRASGSSSRTSLADRRHLLRRLPVRVGVEWRMDLQEMQRQFGKIVSFAPVMITTLWRVASVSLAETNLRISQRMAQVLRSLALDDRDDLEQTSGLSQ